MSEKTTPEEQVATPNEGGEGETPETLEALSITPEGEKKDETVPLKKFMDEKRDRKAAEERASALEKEVADLRVRSIAMRPAEVNEEARRIAAKFDTSEEFVAEVFTAARKSAKEELETTIAPKLSKLENERLIEQRERKFDDVLATALDEMPEYKDIVSKEALKALAFNPANAKKTMAQILEETYGNAVKGKRTLETGHAGKTPKEPNYTAPTETDWAEINSNPAAKEKWSKEALEQVKKYL